jgi:hypothetical protein
MTWRISPVSVVGILLLGGMNVWLLTIIFAELVSDGSIFPEKVKWSPSLQTLGPADQKKRKMDGYTQITARPVFFKTREPFVQPSAPPAAVPKVVAPPPTTDPGFVISGVMISGGLKKVYISTRANANAVWAREGEDLMGWRIRIVDEHGARLEQNGRVIEVALFPK